MGFLDDDQATFDDVLASPLESQRAEAADGKIQIQDFDSDEQFDRSANGEVLNNPQGQGSIFNRTAVESDMMTTQRTPMADESFEKNEAEKMRNDDSFSQATDLRIPPPEDLKALKRID